MFRKSRPPPSSRCPENKGSRSLHDFISVRVSYFTSYFLVSRVTHSVHIFYVGGSQPYCPLVAPHDVWHQYQMWGLRPNTRKHRSAATSLCKQLGSDKAWTPWLLALGYLTTLCRLSFEELLYSVCCRHVFELLYWRILKRETFFYYLNIFKSSFWQFVGMCGYMLSYLGAMNHGFSEEGVGPETIQSKSIRVLERETVISKFTENGKKTLIHKSRVLQSVLIF